MSQRMQAGQGMARRCHAAKPFSTRMVAVRAVAAQTSAPVEELQKKFGIAGSVEVAAGTSGSTKVVLKHGVGTSAEIYLHGACVTSWKQTSGDEVLYVRPDAVFDKSKPISGGIPLCFPQFGPGPKMQQHGFARNLDWSIASTSANPNPDLPEPTVELVLTENDYTMKMFPYKFKAVYTVTLHGDDLRTQLRVINNDDKEFDFTAALHTYIEVLHIGQATVSGLKGLTYLDKGKDPNNPETKVEDREKVGFTTYVDSVYLNAPEHVQLDVGTGAAVTISSSGWDDCVVWNPHHTMKACYEKFVCVENAKFGSPVILAPGKDWSASANFSVVELM